MAPNNGTLLIVFQPAEGGYDKLSQNTSTQLPTGASNVGKTYTGGTDGYPQTTGSGLPSSTSGIDSYGSSNIGRGTMSDDSPYGTSSLGRDTTVLEQAKPDADCYHHSATEIGSSTSGRAAYGSAEMGNSSSTTSAREYGSTTSGTTSTAGGIASSSMPSTMASTGTSAQGDRTTAERSSGGTEYNTLASGTPSGVSSGMTSSSSNIVNPGTTDRMASTNPYGTTNSSSQAPVATAGGVSSSSMPSTMASTGTSAEGDRTTLERGGAGEQYNTLASGTPSGVSNGGFGGSGSSNT